MSARQEQEKYTKSLQYSLDQLTAHSEKFWSEFINEGSVKQFIDLINTLISGATELVGIFGSIPTVIGAIVGIKAFKNEKGLLNFGNLKGFLKESAVNKKDAKAILAFNKAMNVGIQPSKAWIKHMKGATKSARDMTMQALRSKESLVDLAGGFKKATIGAKAMSVATRAASAVGSALASMGISMAISAIISGIDDIIHAEERAAEKRREAAAERVQQTQEALDKSKSEVESVQDIIDKYEELNKMPRNSEYFEEAKKLQSEIVPLIDNEKTGVDLVNGSYEAQLKILKDINEEKSRRAKQAEYDNVEALRENVRANMGVFKLDSSDYNMASTLEDFIGDEDIGKELRSKIESALSVSSKNFSAGDYFSNPERMIDAALDFFGDGEAKKVTVSLAGGDNVDSLIDNYITLKEAYEELYDEGKETTALYDKIGDYLKNMSPVVEPLLEAYGGNPDFYKAYSKNSVSSLDDYKQILADIRRKKQEEISSLYSEEYAAYGGETGSVDTSEIEEYYKDMEAAARRAYPEFAAELDKENAEIQAKITEQKQILDGTISLDRIKESSEAFAPISSAIKELSDDGHITIDTISKIAEVTDLSEAAWEGYKLKLLNAKAGSEEFNQTMTDLMFTILDNKFAIDGNVVATEEEIKALLRENDIANADALTIEYLARAKTNAKIASSDFTEIEEDVIQAILDEGTQAGLTEGQIYSLMIAHIQFNNTNLDPTQKLEALKQIMIAAGMTEEAVNSVFSANSSSGWDAKKTWMEQNGVTTTDDIKNRTGKKADGSVYNYKDYIYDGVRYDTVDDVNAAIANKKLNEIYDNANFTTPVHKSQEEIEKNHLQKAQDYAQSVADIQEDLAEKEKSFAEDMAEAWKKEHLEQLKDGLKAQKDIIDRYKKNVEVLDFGLDNIEEDDFTNRADLLSGKLNKLKSYGAAMRAEFDRVANTIPQTGDEAVELANRLEELGSEMRSNVSEIRETVVALQKLNIDIASTLIDDRMGELKTELDNIDRRIEILNSDYKDDYQYASSVLSMDMLLPTYSEYDKKRYEKQRADRALIDTEQKTQDRINAIVTKSLEMQAKQNAEARAKERAKLVEDMEKAREDAKKKLYEAHKDYVDFLEDNEIETSDTITSISEMFANADIKLAEIDITSVETAADDIKRILGEVFGDNTISFNTNLNDNAGIGGNVVPGYTQVTSPYGYRKHPVTGQKKFHSGTDYGAPAGTPIYAYAAGTVTMAGWNGGYGNCVIIDHGDGNTTLYAHASKLNTVVGSEVKRGQKIAEVGTTGVSTGNHLHFEYRKNGVASDPLHIFPAFASGTIGGNRRASGIGIAGENYKPEILIDKATGKATYISEPTAIDLSKTDVIGEKQTAKLPKFADGTISEEDNKFISSIEGFYNQAVDSISNIEKDIIAQMHKILNNNALDNFTKSQDLYNLKYNSGLAASEAGEKIYNDLVDSYNNWLKAIDEGTATWSLDVYNAYKDAFAGISDLTYEMANGAVEAVKTAAETKWQRSSNWISERNKKGDWSLYGDSEYEAWQRVATWLREEYPKELDKINEADQNAIDARFKYSTDWINERNDYNDWELFSDSEVNAWERVVKWLKAEYPNEIDKIKDAEKNLFDARKNEMEKSIQDIEDYIDARNTYNDWDAYGDSEVKAIQRQTKIIEDMYNQRLISYEEYIDKLEEQSQRIYSLAQNRVDEHLSNIDTYINARNHYNDWEAFGDSETNAIKRQLKILDEAYKLNLISLEEYTEKTEEYTQKLYSAAKNDIIETISELMEDYEEMKSLESSQLESQKTLLQSHYDVTNAIADAQHEINKELRASMSMYEYLNEETRNLLFNQEDYGVLSEELLNIQSAAEGLQKQYQEDILNANAETIAEITAQYQMQYETMMKQYEIAKAELNVAKKRQQLDNVLAERNTRMFINGQWQWVAKTQDVINAQNELADAEIEKKKQEASLEQTEAINGFTAQINALETDLNKVRKYWEDMQEMLNGESDEVAEALRQISEVSSPELKRVIEATGGTVSSFSESISVNTQTMSDVINENLSSVSYGISGFITDLRIYSDAIRALANKVSDAKPSSSSSSSTADIKAQMAANSAAWHTAPTQAEKDRLHDENVRLAKKLGLDEDDYNSGTGKWNYHADGTRYTPGGSTVLGEKEFEAYITNNGRLIPITQPTIGNIGAGGIVFNREQLANLRNLWDLSNLGKITPFVSSSSSNKQNTVVDNSIHINGMTISEKGNEDWINGLRRYVATHK